MAGIVTKTILDGNGDPFDQYFYDDDTALHPVPLLGGAAGGVLGIGQKASAASLPFVVSTEQEAILQAIADALGATLAVDTDVSGLALESGGVLDAIATLLGTIDADTGSIAGKDFSTETTLAAVLAKIIAAPATEAKQDTGNTSLAAIKTAAEIMDDWDESDRAKVNPIVGQAGVAAGAGAVGATVQRVTLASDDPNVAHHTAPTTGTKSNVNDTNSSTTILASNASRKGAVIWNDSTAVLYLDLSGGTASATSCSVKLIADAFYELPDNGKRGCYTGAITGIWASDASGAARVTEFT